MLLSECLSACSTRPTNPLAFCDPHTKGEHNAACNHLILYSDSIFFFASFLRMMKCAQHRGKPKYTFADNNNINRKKNPRSAAQRQFISLGLRRIQPERLLLQPMYPQPHRYRCYWRPVRRVLFSFFSSVCLCIVWRVKIVTGYNTEKKHANRTTFLSSTSGNKRKMNTNKKPAQG